MLKLNTYKKRKLSFEINTQGIDYKLLEGSLKFIIDDIHYGFPVKILQDNISVDIPPLDDVIKSSLQDGKIIECKLDIFGDGFYLKPWSSEFKLHTAIKMEAKMNIEESLDESNPTMTASLKENKTEYSTKRLIEMVMDKLSKKPLSKSRIKKVESKLKGYLDKKKKLNDEKVNLKPKSKILKKKKIVSEKKSIQKKPPKNSIIALMDSYGFKNPKSQKRLLEKAIDISGSREMNSILSTIKQLLHPIADQQNVYESFMKSKFKVQ